MTELVQFFLALGLMIGFAKTLGYLAVRFNQPSALGELIAGVILGPTILNVLGYAPVFPDGEHITKTIIEVAELGVLLLMLMAGMEVDPRSLREVGKPAIFAGLLGVFVPLIVIPPAVMAFGFPFEKSLFIGILLASMSTSITAQVMLEMGVLRQREGLTLLSAALIDDAAVIVLLSLFLAVNPGGIVVGAEARPILEVLLRIGFFMVGGAALSWFVLPRLLNAVSRLPIAEASLTFALVATLLMSAGAEIIGGIAAITGAFFVGIAVRRARRRPFEQIERGIHALNYAFLVPLFFVSIGLQANLRLLTADLVPLTLVLTVLAVLTKVIGAGGGVRLAGESNRTALRIGLGMMSRGEVGLIIAAIGLSYGILSPEVLTVIIFVVLATTIITPPLVRWSFRGHAATSPERLNA